MTAAYNGTAQLPEELGIDEPPCLRVCQPRHVRDRRPRFSRGHQATQAIQVMLGPVRSWPGKPELRLPLHHGKSRAGTACPTPWV